MSAKTTMSITEARRRIFELAEKVQYPNISYTLTEHGRPKAVLMSADEFESWMETLETFRDMPDLGKDIAAHKRAIKDKSYKKYKSLASLLATNKT